MGSGHARSPGTSPCHPFVDFASPHQWHSPPVSTRRRQSMSGIAKVSPPSNWLRIDSRHAWSAGARILRLSPVSVALRGLIGGLSGRGIRSVPPAPTQGQEERSRVGEAAGLVLHSRDHCVLIGLLGTQQGKIVGVAELLLLKREIEGPLGGPFGQDCR